MPRNRSKVRSAQVYEGVQRCTQVEDVSRVPRYCRHKATGQAVVYFAGREHYLGPHGSPESLKLYADLVARWQAGGLPAVREHLAADDLTVVELVAQFLAAARQRYRPAELRAYAVGIKRLLALYAELPVARFGPIALEAVRSVMVAEGLVRTAINIHVHRLRAIWRWGVRRELIPETLHRALLSVPGLRAGEQGVRERTPIRPASWRQIRAVLRCAPPLVRVMARVQLLTGMRPGELCAMRPCDIQRGPAGWAYLVSPEADKCRAHGRPRIVPLGPRARALLEPLLLVRQARPDEYLFQPAASVALNIAARRREPRWPSHAPAVRAARRRRRGVKPLAVSDRYDVASYRRAIRRACEEVWPLPADLERLAGETAAAWQARLGARWPEVAAWRRAHLLHPHQLRHSYLTRVGNRYSEEEAQVLGGHARLSTTQIYVQRDLRRVRPIVEALG
jgi:integrase